MNISGFPVMPACCKTCPFADNGDVELRNAVMARTGLQASQVCHHPRTHGKPETHLCRGARDFQLTLLHRLGLIDAPTDAEFVKCNVEAVRKRLNAEASHAR